MPSLLLQANPYPSLRHSSDPSSSEKPSYLHQVLVLPLFLQHFISPFCLHACYIALCRESLSSIARESPQSRSGILFISPAVSTVAGTEEELSRGLDTLPTDGRDLSLRQVAPQVWPRPCWVLLGPFSSASGKMWLMKFPWSGLKPRPESMPPTGAHLPFFHSFSV